MLATHAVLLRQMAVGTIVLLEVADMKQTFTARTHWPVAADHQAFAVIRGWKRLLGFC